jgi:hypothetical protein
MTVCWNTLIGKTLRIFYDDGEKVMERTGILTAVDETTLFISVRGRSEGIAMSRYIRHEVEEIGGR